MSEIPTALFDSVTVSEAATMETIDLSTLETVVLTPEQIAAGISAALGIGEINPGANNPTMTPGHNNAIYCEIGQDNGKNSSSNVYGLNGLAIYSVWDATQGKYKYWIRFIVGTAPPTPKAIPAGAKILMVPAHTTTTAYWQVEDVNGKDVCTIGESIMKAVSTSALVIKQTTNPSLPSQ